MQDYTNERVKGRCMCVCVCVCVWLFSAFMRGGLLPRREKRPRFDCLQLSPLFTRRGLDLVLWRSRAHRCALPAIERVVVRIHSGNSLVCCFFVFFFLLRFHPIWITNHLDCLDWVRIASHLERTFNVICLRATGAGLGAVPCARGQVPLGKVLLVRISVCRSLCSEFSNPQVLPVLPCHFSPLLSNALSYASLCPSACPSLVSSTRPSQLFAPSPLIIAHTRRNSSFVWDN